MSKPTILFDLDGTVIDSTEAILESFHNSFRHYNVQAPSDEKIKALIGHPLDVMYSSLGIDDALVRDYVDTYKQHYRKISCLKTILLPYAVEAIELASSFARLGIVTTKTAKYSQELMEHFNLMSHFEVLIGRENVENPKPHKEPVEKALAAMNVSKKSAWLIGDTNMDIGSANNAEIKHVAVSSGYETLQQLQEHTDIIESDVLQAVKKIELFYLN
jgi:phosphoglycolate phosphatase